MVEDVERGEVDVEGVAKSFGVLLFLVGSGGRAIFLLVVGESWEKKRDACLSNDGEPAGKKKRRQLFFLFLPFPSFRRHCPPSDPSDPRRPRGVTVVKV